MRIGVVLVMGERFRIMTLITALALVAGLLTLATATGGNDQPSRPSSQPVDVALWSATFCGESASTRLLIDSGPNALSAGLATEVTDPESAALAKQQMVA